MTSFGGYLYASCYSMPGQRAHSRYGLHARQVPSTPEASAASLPPRLLQSLPAGATVAEQDSHLLKDSALSRRTKNEY